MIWIKYKSKYSISAGGPSNRRDESSLSPSSKIQSEQNLPDLMSLPDTDPKSWSHLNAHNFENPNILSE